MKKLWPFLLFLASLAHGTPSVTGVSGTISAGSVISVTGAAFGSKSPALPVLWADFETSTGPVTPLSTHNQFDDNQNLNRTAGVGFGGSYGMQGTAGSWPWTLRVDSSSPYWTQPGQKNYLSRRTKKNYQITDPSQNYKIIRQWAHAITYPDLYAASNNGRLFTEGVANPPDPGCYTDIHGWNVDTTGWAHEEFYETGSSAGTKDGNFTYRVNGSDKTSCSIITSDSTGPAYMENFFVEHEVPANTASWTPSWSSSNNVWVDEIYVDTSWSHVVIGNASTWTACTDFNNVIPTAWGTTSITATIGATTAFSGGATAYVYVFDSNGTPNTSGYAVTVGGGGLPAPNLTSVSPPTGSTAGGETFTMGGTNFINGFRVLIGTTSAQSQAYGGSTSGTFVTPSLPAGTYSITLINPDTQASTLSSALTLTSPVVAPLMVLPWR